MRLLDHGDVRLRIGGPPGLPGRARGAPLADRVPRLLRHFLEHPGRVASRRQLLDCVWGAGTPDSRTVDATVYQLRRALNADGEPDLLRTVRAKGHLPTARAKGYALACEPGARTEPALDGRARPAAPRATLSPRMPVTDELWRRIEPLLPPRPARGNGRPILTDRAALAASSSCCKSGMDWTTLPKELGCGSGATCRERLRLWKNAGIWDRIQRRPWRGRKSCCSEKSMSTAKTKRIHRLLGLHWYRERNREGHHVVWRIRQENRGHVPW